ncbi:RNA 2',3'-cyclic phosphodiesterase [Corynebacterium sanguinis]|uniref:RNA 2',3'-cyclic phosphodiesterase n=1 Tax=Corynebacterium sanguinis TaxID=2594913 RepID=UPI0021B05510|nr:RNA 2',3'-cyclic phosphodiesterase [Corynebacterium sanguinis]MCT1806005.1 RNA 2',3'-cyclic phosphodiesterase [Corynebacterium sanguinis]MCT2159410.1 RNA 2',3'-cyclic phosphodiesterase [Corynebacterium sanguinis]
MRRLFAAVLPPDEVREHLVRALRPIRDLSSELRWTDPDTWHLTMAFYGNQPNDAAAVTDHLAQATAFRRPLRLHLRGAGAFDRRTLWIGVGGDKPQLRELMADCSVDCDERRRQRAHLTVAKRCNRTRDVWLMEDHSRALSVYCGPDFTVDEVHLMESHLGQGRGGGPRYDIVDTFYLR